MSLPGKLADCSDKNPENCEILHRRGRLLRRLRQDGERPGHPGHPASPWQDPECGEGPPGQDLWQRGDQGDDHCLWNRDPRRFRHFQIKISQDYHHDRCGRGRSSYQYSAPYLPVPVHAGSYCWYPVLLLSGCCPRLSSL